jgi:hypothetical protein
MPEVQEPVLEHAPTKEEITRGGDVVNLVTSVTEMRKMDEPKLVESEFLTIVNRRIPLSVTGFIKHCRGFQGRDRIAVHGLGL